MLGAMLHVMTMGFAVIGCGPGSNALTLSMDGLINMSEKPSYVLVARSPAGLLALHLSPLSAKVHKPLAHRVKTNDKVAELVSHASTSGASFERSEVRVPSSPSCLDVSMFRWFVVLLACAARFANF